MLQCHAQHGGNHHTYEEHIDQDPPRPALKMHGNRQQEMFPRNGRGLGMRNLWLLFAQTVTVLLAVVFVLLLILPQWRLFPRVNDRGLGVELTMRHSLDRVVPSVVSIRTEIGGGAPDQYTDLSHVNLGSGVIVSKRGHVITNHHVIHKAERIQVLTSAGERISATVIGSDPDIDIAVLQLKTDKLLPAVQFQTKENPLQAGDMVMSVGSPYGLASTASLGIVSATGRSNLGLSKYEHFIQTDAAINHGSSGGALANVHGELVGISTGLFSKQLEGYSAQGIGFAIPVEMALVAYDEIVQHGRFRRGWIGLDLRKLEDEDGNYGNLDALRVEKVVAGSPSEAAGLLPGDLVLAIDGRSPSKITYLEEATGKLLRPGDTLNLAVRRGGVELLFKVAVIEK